MGSNNPPGKSNALVCSDTSRESSLLPVQSITVPVAYNNNSQDEIDHQATQDMSGLPASSGGNPLRMSDHHRRPPRNLQGLLKFAMDATQAEDAPGNSEIGPMDEQRRQFLEEALRSLTVNVSEVLDNAIKVLTNLEKVNSIQEEQPLPDEVRNSFTILLDYVDDIDVANDFYKMGGFAMFPICYGCKNEEVRARASSVLGTLCQNNPFCQTRALDCGLLHVLLNLVQSEQGNTLAKCLYAISCASREFEPACRELIAQGGCQILAHLLPSDQPAARTKAAFLIRYLCQHYDDARKLFIKENIIKIIAGLIQAGRDDSTEHLLSILDVLVNSKDANVLRLCKDPRYNLRKVLEDHLKRPELKDDRYQEEKEYCNLLINTLFSSRQQLNNVEKADR